MVTPREQEITLGSTNLSMDGRTTGQTDSSIPYTFNAGGKINRFLKSQNYSLLHKFLYTIFHKKTYCIFLTNTCTGMVANITKLLLNHFVYCFIHPFEMISYHKFLLIGIIPPSFLKWHKLPAIRHYKTIYFHFIIIFVR